jgi:predicted kinase
MCGLPCAGKTTLAREIEARGALRLTTDEWLHRMFGADVSIEQAHTVRDQLEALLFDVAERALELGLDVVVDFGVWSRDERETFRARASKVGARSELHYLDVPHDELLRRMAARNASPPFGTFRFTEAHLAEWSTWFEPPAADELLPREV